jgi:hypothetical protein
MERLDTRWQLVLRTVLRRKCRWLVTIGLLMAGGGAILQAAPQHFAVAIPAMEGPVTMGIFSEQGKLVRLLYWDAPVETIPSGLNGLIMTWDGKDDRGVDVPAGTYRARGLVHGPIRTSVLPFCTTTTFPPLPEEEPGFPFPGNRIVLRAAEDELLDSRPLLAFSAVEREDSVGLEVEGLPVVSISLQEVKGSAKEKVFCKHGPRAGEAVLVVERGNFQESYLVKGLDRIVPMDAGKLEVSADASNPAPNAGESAP